jgi:hypothetical protein
MMTMQTTVGEYLRIFLLPGIHPYLLLTFLFQFAAVK